MIRVGLPDAHFDEVNTPQDAGNGLLFDHFVGTRCSVSRTVMPRHLTINHQLEFGRDLNQQIARGFSPADRD
jgi:hypothetical protein